ncbi:GyrI-like domain-containing protein [Microbacterium sp. 2216-1]|uniref:GyrI-like domain-containing protein n=1 Tax=Microbacterium sp. 2216-1 TaxID=3390053 RepID=UPI003974DCC7
MDTPTYFTNPPFTVLGFAIRTDGAGSQTSIPALWEHIHSEGLLESIPGRRTDSVYAVYTHLENAGVNRDGWFTFLIGAEVDPATPVPNGMTLVTVPQSARATFNVPGADPTRVIEAWSEAWGFDDGRKTFLCEYEEYGANGVFVALGVSEQG